MTEMGGADLHLHSTASDGRWTPQRLAAEAAARGLQGIAVTDHDTTAGVEAAHRACRQLGLAFLTGVELSTDYAGTSVHILGYGFSPQDSGLSDLLLDQQIRRQERMARMVAAVNDLGVPVTLAQVQAAAGDAASVGRPHLAQVLVETGAVASMGEAFDRYLGRGQPAYAPRALPDLPDAIDCLHEAGGVAVLAHPGLVPEETSLTALLSLPFDGLEVYHPTHDRRQSEQYLALAEGRGLLVTGGSDFHAPQAREGYPIGSVRVSLDRMRRIAVAAATRSESAEGTERKDEK